MKMKALQSFETWDTVLPPRHPRILEDLCLQQHDCKNVKFRDLLYIPVLLKTQFKLIIVKCIHTSLKSIFTPLFVWELLCMVYESAHCKIRLYRI
jgi:hypothetical protein